ncbi:hypothetical protein GF356_05670, partial [candidate division GN15 bacterium]|nr:hypothetical protein [candidate division GN15 bacterium]
HLWNVASEEPDVTLWAVRKVKECQSDVRTNGTSRRGAGVRGVVIHYNSGQFISERRGRGTVLLRNALDESGANCLSDNTYWGASELCLRILAQLDRRRRLGYHYHLERNGEIVATVDEEQRTNHAGASREPDTVEAERSGGAGAPQTNTHTNNRPREA